MSNLYLKIVGALAAGVGSLDKYTEEHKQFLSSGYKCPNCGKTLINQWGVAKVNMYSASGEKVALWSARIAGAETVECTQCHYKWKLRDTSVPVETNTLELLSITETERIEENMGTDNRVIDNSKSSVKLTRKFSVSKEWSRTYSIEYEKAQMNNSEINIGVDDITSLKLGMEETIRKQYSISDQTKEIYSEGVEIEVPGFTKLSLSFQWKRIWQCGFVAFRNQDNEEVKVPYRVVVGVTFDQRQVDENIDK